MAFIIKMTESNAFDRVYWSDTFQWGQGWIENPILANKFGTREEADRVAAVIKEQRDIRTIVIEVP